MRKTILVLISLLMCGCQKHNPYMTVKTDGGTGDGSYIYNEEMESVAAGDYLGGFGNRLGEVSMDNLEKPPRFFEYYDGEEIIKYVPEDVYKIEKIKQWPSF